MPDEYRGNVYRTRKYVMADRKKPGVELGMRRNNLKIEKNKQNSCSYLFSFLPLPLLSGILLVVEAFLKFT